MERHRLITNGVYGLVHHPDFGGFFVWSVGTQIMLCNPLLMIVLLLSLGSYLQSGSLLRTFL